MAEVKWIKITTDMFDNRKIKHLRRLPEGNNIVLIWVMLLTMAGRCNSGGMIFLTENIPYTPKMLADELDFEESTVRLALEALERLNMIVVNGDLFTIAGWGEHQNIEGMEKIREQGRKRVAAYREKQKALPEECNVTCNVTVTECNGLDIDIEEDKNKNKKENIEGDKSPRAPRFTPPTLSEVEAYCRERGNNVNAERFVDFYESKGWMVGKNKMKDWKAAVRGWEQRENGGKRNERNSKSDNEFEGLNFGTVL